MPMVESCWARLEMLLRASLELRDDCRAMKIITDERCTTYHSAGHPERPQRVARTTEKLRAQSELALDWATPIVDVPDEVILRAHTQEHLARVKAAAEDFDGDTPAHADTLWPQPPECNLLPGNAWFGGQAASGALRRL